MPMKSLKERDDSKDLSQKGFDSDVGRNESFDISRTANRMRGKMPMKEMITLF